ncbi:MAG: flagellar hook protein FlgE [Bacillota bacterium]|nr:flagellar hook protein FlgE [Bacillota bacterium]
MMRSLFSGISGLRNHQTRMDVIGNNIANINTVAFKSSRVNFQEVFSQTLRGGSSPGEYAGGQDPMQIGLGMALGSIDSVNIPGNVQTTGLMTDMAIQGDGFFILSDGSGKYYSRAGDLRRDGQDYLVSVQGMRVKGWMAASGEFGTRNRETMTDLRIPMGKGIPAKPTEAAQFTRNLDSGAPVGTQVNVAFGAYDSLGNSHDVTVSFEKTAGLREWTWTATGAGVAPGSTGTIIFGPDGAFDSEDEGLITIAAPAAEDIVIDPQFDEMTQFSSPDGVSTAELSGSDGSGPGVLKSFTVDSQGVITGAYSNGANQPIAQVALAFFPNPAGLLKIGEGLSIETANAGLCRVDAPGSSGTGAIAPASLEMSNVDLAAEFTNMIITQRGFQASSRIITASDEMLQELANLKR